MRSYQSIEQTQRAVDPEDGWICTGTIKATNATLAQIRHAMQTGDYAESDALNRLYADNTRQYLRERKWLDRETNRRARYLMLALNRRTERQP